MLARLRSLLNHRFALAGILGVTAVLCSPIFATDLILDDLTQRAMARGSLEGLERGWLEYFRFFPDDPAWRELVREQGFVPWYAGTELHAAFWRPLSSISISLDIALGGNDALIPHVHSLAWYLLLIVSVSLLYRELVVPRWVALLGVLVYAIDDAHGLPIGWSANRNAIIATTLATLGLWQHVLWRRRGRTIHLFHSLGFLACGLLAGEMALSITAYLFAYAVFLDDGPATRRALALLPAAAVSIAWQLVYRGLGYGTGGSGLYIDPVGEPLRFARALFFRWPILFQSQYTPFVSDGFPMLPPAGRVIAGGIACAALLAAIFALRRWFAARPEARFFALGSAIAALPLCATFPNDRLLFPVGIGGAAVVGLLIADAFAGDAARRAHNVPVPVGRGARAIAAFFVVTHLILSPLHLPARCYLPEVLGGMYRDASYSLDVVSDDLGGRTLVIAWAPDFFYGPYAAATRPSLDRQAPRKVRTLSTGLQPFSIERTSERSFAFRSTATFLDAPFDRLLRHPDDSFSAGESFENSDVRIVVREVSVGGWPIAYDVQFKKNPTAADFVWVIWAEGGYERFSPPAVGEAVHVEPQSLVELIVSSLRNRGIPFLSN